MISWTNISKNEKITIEFAKTFKDKLNWTLISEHMPIDIEFVETFKDKLNWRLISQRMHMEDDFMLHYQDKLDWDELILRLEPSLYVIERVTEEIDWQYISSLDVSLSFIEKYENYLDFTVLFLYNAELTTETIKKHYDKFNWEVIDIKTEHHIFARKWIENNIQFLNIERLKKNEQFSIYREEDWERLENMQKERK